MSQPSPDRLREVHGQLAEHATHLGEHIAGYARLLAERDALVHPHDGAGGGASDADPEDGELQLPRAPDDETARRDRIDHLNTIRQILYRLLYVIDFTLIHDRLDRLQLRDAHHALIEAIDAADTSLINEGAHRLNFLEGDAL